MDSAENAPFPETSWAKLRPSETTDRAAAFRALAEGYLTPTVAFLRYALRRDQESARDIAHDFFLWVLESGFLEKADPARGPFRGFLKTALRRYVIDADRRLKAQRRGGPGVRFLAPEEVPDVAVDQKSAEDAFDRAWRNEVLERAFKATADALAAAGQEDTYRLFADWAVSGTVPFDHAAAAERYGISKIDVSNRLTRTKEKFRAHVRAIILESVASPVDLDQELRGLLGGGA